ncbi:dimethylallyltranstransferase [Amycolatopsis antarctica]|uniref:Dimethylallyltranstransferase n=1 Tax=Amycolatopsis antarctica TaxID=1854586 RepID=A0A263D2F6_9PSEU|nr:polyprenyl synthetase family protein [Amycolatopsis antarctica]OZM72258.1 dimethylallyltranstransferase [Amycolatopsis antarctica]
MTGAEQLIREITTSSLADEVRDALARRWQPGDGRIHEISRYALLAPGKLLRPLLLAATAETCGAPREQVLPAALAVEYLHVASLVHDDIIDGDDLRRGRASVHARFGMSDAIVTGDALLFQVFASLAECADRGASDRAVLAAIGVLAKAGVDLCEGQAQEARLAAAADGTVAEYLRVAELKTGALFRGACRAGALLAGAEPATADGITRYAEHAGLAFQLRDDVLPYVGDAAVVGKPDTSDAANLRLTMPVLLAREVAGPQDRAALDRALTADLTARERFAVLTEVLDRTGALEKTQQRAEAEAALAEAELESLSPSEGRDLLSALARLSTSRDR